MSLKSKILSAAEQMYLRFGLRSVTMDDIASELAMSKKTIYQYIKDKKELVQLAMDKNMCDHEKESNAIFKEILHPIDQMVAIFDMVHRRTKSMHPSLLFELKRIYPELFKKINGFREEFVFKKILLNIKKGVEMGLYRNDFDIALIARFYIICIEETLQQKKGEETQIPHKQYELMNYHLRGIVTEMGLNYLTKHPINNGNKI